MNMMVLVGLGAVALIGVVGVGAAATMRRPPPVTSSAAGSRGLLSLRVAKKVWEDAAETQCSLYLEPEDGQPLPTFVPGQYLTLVMEIGGKTLYRSYSMSAAPRATHYRVTVKRAGEGSSYLLDQVQVGATVRAQPPAGRFVPRDGGTAQVLVGGGVGLTPLMSMLHGGVLATGAPVWLFYGVRDGSGRAFRSELAALTAANPNLRVVVAYSRPRPEDAGDADHTGHIDAELISRLVAGRDHRYYVCGPTGMMSTLVPALRTRGEVFVESFTVGGASAAQPGTSTGDDAFPVTFAKSKQTCVWDGSGANLLEFAERKGIKAEYGCLSGSCGSCEVRLLSGEVRYAEPPDHQIREGRCLLCVGKPASAIEIDA
jgi:ferredoxin-NADP reductase